MMHDYVDINIRQLSERIDLDLRANITPAVATSPPFKKVGPPTRTCSNDCRSRTMSLTLASLRSSQSLARSALLIQVRYASTGPKKRTGTAQDVDRLLEEQRKQARMAPGMDPTRQGLILFRESLVWGLKIIDLIK
jgi:hypothetical protein